MTRVLVPLAILEGESVSAGLTQLLAPLNVTVLGYHVLPEQTPPDQARLQYGDRATDALEDVAAEFRAAGGDADHRLVFTQDRTQTIDRVAATTSADAYAIAGSTGPVDRVLVALTGDVAVDRICTFVTELIGSRDIGVTLFLATDDESGDAGRQLLGASSERLAEHGIDVQTNLAVGDPPFETLVDAAIGHDAIIMGERAPSLRSLIFGEDADRVAAESVGPVLVVRNVEDAEQTDERSSPSNGDRSAAGTDP